MSEEIIRITSREIQNVLFDLFLKYNFPEAKATLLAEVFTESTLTGVTSHGVNRVPRFIDYLERGLVRVDAEAELAEAFGNMERWEGNLGPGIINAIKCTDRAIELAGLHGMGLVALRNTNHWMRGGTYGRRAAEAGCISILFTNTQPNMPPWGGKDSRIGNNPFVVSIPGEREPVVLDMALSQFSFGKISDYQLRGEKLPFPGGWDDNDTLSDDPEKILPKERGLPIGYWKGSAFSMILDMLATLLSAGDSTFRIGRRGFETGISQVFLCIDQKTFGDLEFQHRLLKEIIDYTHDVEPMEPAGRTYYPGEKSAAIRSGNLKQGIAVNKSVWQNILELNKSTM